ncbi:unnamed protein product [Linum tenue]|uniref:Protein kinase domain-containing protein n=1 Tax=Linum tenue TaxID=586396 RepID=A0AAV0QKG2_9ROSI|nr:unnamed protein product [Linum tenue]
MGKIQGNKLLLGLVFIGLVILVLAGSGEGQDQGFLINCGTSSTIQVDGRNWTGDLAPSNSNLTLSSPGFSATTSEPIGDSIFSQLYKTARIFTTDFNYTFHGVQGASYFLRLHFHPAQFQNYNASESLFSVAVNGLRLLSEISVAGDISHRNSILLKSSSNSSFPISLVKEYILTGNGTELVVEFIPAKGSFGFVNAIEIVEVESTIFPETLSKVGGGDVSLGPSRRGIETMHRLNVGGHQINPDQDSGLGRLWEDDSSYMIHNSSNVTYASSGGNNNNNVTTTSVVAPLLVYESARAMSNTQVLEKRFNMSWRLEVDPGFDYMVRLHFCELESDRANQRIFRIYINNKTAADNFDVYARAGGKNKAYHEDFFDVLSSGINTIWVQLGPDAAGGAPSTDALLSGLEVFKLSRNGNLAYVNKLDSPGKSRRSGVSRTLLVGIGAVIGCIAIMATLGGIFCCYSICMKLNREEPGKKNPSTGWRPLFNVHEIRAATNNFDDGLVIGVGGFGKVYKGETEDGLVMAIKRANPQSQQGLAEFETEIEMLSKLRHRHLVSMIGFCEENHEMILVYEYMSNGTLRSHLFGSDGNPFMTWKQRLEVCIGAARGLHYLHTGADRGVIHRDVKTTNILLDENFVAKVADFGLSRTGPGWDHTHVSTAVKGSFGYLDPEYFRRQQLTEKSDVYSFGVVLFEVVCARAVINPSLPKDEINLAEWAMRWQRQRSLETIIDRRLEGSYSPESMEKYGEIAEKCLADEGKNRPTMGEVLWHLEYVLQLHEAWLQLQQANPTEVSISGGHQSIEASQEHQEQQTSTPQSHIDEDQV